MTRIVISAAEAKEELSEILNRVSHHKEHVIITRRGKEIAAIIPMEELQVMEEKQNRSDLDEALDALKQSRQEGSITLEELKRK